MAKHIFGSLAVRLAVSAVAAGLFVGCEKSETKPADATKSAASDASKSAADASKSAGDAGKSAADAAGAAANNAPAAAAGDKAAPAAAAVPADTAAAPAAAAEGDAKAQATDLLTKVETYVKENKMDLAEKALAELDKLKPQLPAEYQSKIDTAHTMFDTAKKGQGLGELKDNLLKK
jgi:hypothetical protein